MEETVSATSKTLILQPRNAALLAQVCGELNTNLQLISSRLEVKLHNRGNAFHIEGTATAVKSAEQFLRMLHRQVSEGDEISAEKIHLMLLNQSHRQKQADFSRAPAAGASSQVRLKRSNIEARSPNQSRYIEAIRSCDINFGIGPAGTGKTWLAVCCSVEALQQHRVKRIVLTRPAVEAGERLGFLPGDLSQKVDPYLQPLYDALYSLLGREETSRLSSRGIIEIVPLAYMRGRTLSDAFVILDEAQNTTPSQIKMFLTRIGFNSIAVINGDLTQTDLPPRQLSGLAEAVRILRNVKGLSFVRFDENDIVRHPLVRKIITSWEKDQAAAHSANDKPMTESRTAENSHSQSPNHNS